MGVAVLSQLLKSPMRKAESTFGSHSRKDQVLPFFCRPKSLKLSEAPMWPSSNFRVSMRRAALPSAGTVSAVGSSVRSSEPKRCIEGQRVISSMPLIEGHFVIPSCGVSSMPSSADAVPGGFASLSAAVPSAAALAAAASDASLSLAAAASASSLALAAAAASAAAASSLALAASAASASSFALAATAASSSLALAAAAASSALAAAAPASC
mmetsp:Transcript_70712/g.210868  ORF Transcript_70712/g.210868 Transcript_70712/m.210868 type:complete len:212 (+) Transcript_70712:3192-3827(+)